MAAVWFISAPLFSHTDWGGLLKTAQAVQAAGHTVTWVSGPAIADAVLRAGVPFAPIAATGWLWPPPPAPDLSTLSPQEAVMLRYRRALDTWMSEALVAEAVEAILGLARERGAPDLIVSDPFLTAAALAAEALSARFVVGGWPAQRELGDDSLFPVQRALGSESRDRLDRLLARFGLRGTCFSGGATPSLLSPALHLCYFTPGWYAADAADILAQTRFVGGLPDVPGEPPPAWLDAIPADAPLAVITLGTTFAGEGGFFSWAAHSAARAGLVPVIAIGFHPMSADEKAKLRASLPPGSRLLNWVPFAHVLPRARVLVHHGGMGTTHAGAVYGVPQIAVPHAADQRGNARRIAQAKVGLNLTAHDVKKGLLLQAVRAIADDGRVAETARALAAELAGLGGPSQAAAHIETVLAAPG